MAQLLPGDPVALKDGTLGGGFGPGDGQLRWGTTFPAPRSLELAHHSLMA